MKVPWFWIAQKLVLSRSIPFDGDYLEALILMQVARHLEHIISIARRHRSYLSSCTSSFFHVQLFLPGFWSVPWFSSHLVCKLAILFWRSSLLFLNLFVSHVRNISNYQLLSRTGREQLEFTNQRFRWNMKSALTPFLSFDDAWSFLIASLGFLLFFSSCFCLVCWS